MPAVFPKAATPTCPFRNTRFQPALPYSGASPCHLPGSPCHPLPCMFMPGPALRAAHSGHEATNLSGCGDKNRHRGTDHARPITMDAFRTHAVGRAILCHVRRTCPGRARHHRPSCSTASRDGKPARCCSFIGGSGEIRTHERLPVAGFQDRCNRPLCHASCNCLRDGSFDRLVRALPDALREAGRRHPDAAEQQPDASIAAPGPFAWAGLATILPQALPRPPVRPPMPPSMTKTARQPCPARRLRTTEPTGSTGGTSRKGNVSRKQSRIIE